MWAGITGAVINNGTILEVAMSIHDSVYNTDFGSSQVKLTPGKSDENAKTIERHIIEELRKFSSEHLCKFLGAGITLSLLKEVRRAPPTPAAVGLSLTWADSQTPNLCTRLWMDLDIVPIVFNIKGFQTDSLTRPNIKHRISSTTGSYVPSGAETPTVYVDPSVLGVEANKLGSGVSTRLPIPRTLDEQADSAARKCLMYFGPGNNPRLTIGPRNQVTVDAAGKIHVSTSPFCYLVLLGLFSQTRPQSPAY